MQLYLVYVAKKKFVAPITLEHFEANCYGSLLIGILFVRSIVCGFNDNPTSDNDKGTLEWYITSFFTSPRKMITWLDLGMDSHRQEVSQKVKPLQHIHFSTFALVDCNTSRKIIQSNKVIITTLQGERERLPIRKI